VAVSSPAPSLAAGQHVQVRLPHVGALPASVEASGPGVMIVALTVRDDRVARLDGARVSVEHASGRGIHRYTGTLRIDGARPELLHVALAGDAERIQRREWARVEAVLPVAVRGVDEPVGGDTMTRNVSGGGLLIQDPWGLSLGSDVRIELRAEPGAEPIRALGCVVRALDGDLKGVRFEDMGRPDEERLIRLVRERERAALRTARGR